MLGIEYDRDAASVRRCNHKDVSLIVVRNRFKRLDADIPSSESGGVKSVEVTFDI